MAEKRESLGSADEASAPLTCPLDGKAPRQEEEDRRQDPTGGDHHVQRASSLARQSCCQFMDQSTERGESTDMDQSTDDVDNAKCFCKLSNVVVDPSWSLGKSIDNDCGCTWVWPALKLVLVETLMK